AFMIGMNSSSLNGNRVALSRGNFNPLTRNTTLLADLPLILQAPMTMVGNLDQGRSPNGNFPSASALLLAERDRALFRLHDRNEQQLIKR
ncbi:hypothetical protein, partial [Cronobacter sakazakii]|uniref:hypothetical protein n=1 Tax=Cronobacter sakazakii TaxID=28141 RepID=UPI001F3B7FB3